MEVSGGSTPIGRFNDRSTVNMHFRTLKMIATSGFLTALECTEFVFARGSAPDPAGGAYSAPPDLLAGLAGWEGREKEGGRGGRTKELC